MNTLETDELLARWPAFRIPADWTAVLMLVPTTVLGGFAGGKLAQRLPATLLRYLVVVIAAAVAVYLVLD